MDEKTLTTLEFPKVLEKLAEHAAFSASAELARSLRPTNHMQSAIDRLATTSEARLLISIKSDISVGGASDIRPLVNISGRGGVLTGPELLEVKNTLIAARELYRSFERQTAQFPHLSVIAINLQPPPGVIEGISRAISERGDILDSASVKLSSIRKELKIAHDRLLSRLEKMINDPKNAPMLQDPIITQRNGRYVIPLRADFKGRVRSIVHDQSSSGATLFVEPLVVVDLNNRWHELQLEERDEERRILAELSALVGDQAELLNVLVDSLAKLDLALMCAKYAEELHASEPVLHPLKPGQKDHHPGSVIKLYLARHPLIDPQTVVPLDVVLDAQTYSVVITGPNTGGKTVTLKTVGLIVAMSQSGLHVPAQSGSEISLFEDVFADIGDEQSIEQSLSTFSGHITNIVRILNNAGSKSLVLLDELGAGTDPQEGAALARSLLSYLLEKRIPCLIATHYPELKSYAHTTPGVINASMEFDLQSLRPTYRLTLGLPGRSNALAIAERLGLPQAIIKDARSAINPEDLHAEDLLDEIYRQREISREERAKAERIRNDIEKQRADLNLRLDRIEDERQKVLATANQQAEEQIIDLRKELEDLRKALTRARQPIEALKPLQDQVDTLQEQIEQPVERINENMSISRPIKVGDKVKLRSLNMGGVVVSMGLDGAEVRVGNLRIRAKLDDILPHGTVEDTRTVTPSIPSKKQTPASPAAASRSIFHTSPGMELDLRGQRAEDALEALDRYLENAFLAGMPFVRIIHGKGTGKLRQVIREALQQSPHISRFETGHEKEGGDGVTVAHLRTD